MPVSRRGLLTTVLSQVKVWVTHVPLAYRAPLNPRRDALRRDERMDALRPSASACSLCRRAEWFLVRGVRWADGGRWDTEVVARLHPLTFRCDKALCYTVSRCKRSHSCASPVRSGTRRSSSTSDANASTDSTNHVCCSGPALRAVRLGASEKISMPASKL